MIRNVKIHPQKSTGINYLVSTETEVENNEIEVRCWKDSQRICKDNCSAFEIDKPIDRNVQYVICKGLPQHQIIAMIVGVIGQEDNKMTQKTLIDEDGIDFDTIHEPNQLPEEPVENYYEPQTILEKVMNEKEQIRIMEEIIEEELTLSDEDIDFMEQSIREQEYNYEAQDQICGICTNSYDECTCVRDGRR
jgi:hypothetical protein